MPSATEQIVCPKYPDHGMATKRCLLPKDREIPTKVIGDVFEIDCQYCGRYEYQALGYGESPRLRSK